MEECGNPTCRKACENPKVCARCRAVPYCSRACQKAHYKAHKKICGTLNANKASQLRHRDHWNQCSDASVQRTIGGLSLFSRESQELYRLSMATTKEQDPRSTARTLAKMNSLASRVDLLERQQLLIQIIPIIITKAKWRLTLPTSLVLVLLNSGVDPSALTVRQNQSSPDENSYTALHYLAQLARTDDPKVNENLVIVGRQLIEAGANVNARAGSNYLHKTPLHDACASARIINLEYIELLLDHGANPNLQDSTGATPLMYTNSMAMGAAKLLLTYDYSKSASVPIDVNVQTQNGSTVLGEVRIYIRKTEIEREQAKRGVYKGDKGWTSTDPFDHLLGQMKEVEALLVSKGAVDKFYWSIKNSYAAATAAAADMRGQSVQSPPLPYDVGALFDKDLSDAKAVPSWFSVGSFYIDDDVVRQFEVTQKKDHLHSSDGKPPALGQKLLIRFELPEADNSWGWLAGEINEVGPEPTNKQLKRSGSFLYGNGCTCRNPKCQMTKTGQRFEIIRKHGALHGQEVKGVVSLSDTSPANEACFHFFRGADARYAVVLRCNDNEDNMWEMVRISPLDSSSHQQSQGGGTMCAQGCGNPGSKICAACKQVRYCSEACQREHWRVHKRDCRKKREEMANGDAP